MELVSSSGEDHCMQLHSQDEKTTTTTGNHPWQVIIQNGKYVDGII